MEILRLWGRDYGPVQLKESIDSLRWTGHQHTTLIKFFIFFSHGFGHKSSTKWKRCGNNENVTSITIRLVNAAPILKSMSEFVSNYSRTDELPENNGSTVQDAMTELDCGLGQASSMMPFMTSYFTNDETSQPFFGSEKVSKIKNISFLFCF